MKRIIDRFDKYLEIKKISDNQVTIDLGLSIGLLGKSRKEGRELSKNVVAKILNFYTDIEKIWLLTGEGEMLKSDGKNEVNEPYPAYYCSKCQEKETLINQLIGENNVLREQLNLPIPERNKKVS